MKLKGVAISNYRALRDVNIPLSKFGCLIGENNAGKSSFLQAISLFFSGSKLSSRNYFDSSLPVRIEISIEEITEDDLVRLAPEHRSRVSAIVRNGKLSLVRLYDTTGKGSLLYKTLMPTDERFSDESLAALMKGGRPGPAFVTKIVKTFPELEGVIDPNMNQDMMRQTILDLAERLPDERKTSVDLALPTGIDKSISPLLPDPIYIPAVKDLSDDIKTTESTPFGKILAILLRVAEDKLPDVQQLFKQLNSQLNRVESDDGTVADDRLEEVKTIEATVEKYVQHSFSDVSLRLEIPPPELKTIFSSARLSVDDGVDGLLDTKGDGLRRAVVFAILRSYVELNTALGQQGTKQDGDTDVNVGKPAYFLLFEEPELFLHPKAQHILFEALKVFAADHHVLVTTHSPMFFGANATETFVKLSKTMDEDIASKPFTLARPVDLSDLTAKDQFQIICFESNNAAFFADSVVLVEGDSDYLLFPHIARTLNPQWDVSRLPVHFARITGKGNIRRYRDFFHRFGVRVSVIADLDLLLEGFQHVPFCESVVKLRNRLIDRVDQLVEPDGPDAEPTGKEAKKAHGSGELKGLWKKVKLRSEAFKSEQCTFEHVQDAMDDFLGWQRKSDRLSILMGSDDSELLQLKWELLDALRLLDVYVLERGAIESYYPDAVTGSDKPSRAQRFCEEMLTADAILSCCGKQKIVRNGDSIETPEFTLIFESIFKKTAV